MLGAASGECGFGVRMMRSEAFRIRTRVADICDRWQAYSKQSVFMISFDLHSYGHIKVPLSFHLTDEETEEQNVHEGRNMS